MKPNLNEVLILDIECWSDFDIDKQHDEYRADAKVKWIGFYSYKYNRYDTVKVKGNEEKILKYIEQHKVFVSFNGDDFDIPILKNPNNRFMHGEFIKSIDLYTFLFGDVMGMKKPKAHLMGLDFPSKSLRVIAETLKFPTLKGDIDYTVFKKDEWTKEEEDDIKKYLLGDIEVTKLLFEKIYNFWLPFTDFIDEKNVKKWRFLSASIASIGYMYACNVLHREELYGYPGQKSGMGGKVIEPRVNEANDVYYVDVGSLYPHIYALFNLFQETNKDNPNAWHGNDTFKVRGYYDISKPCPLATDIMKKFKLRMKLKKEDPNNPQVYTIKILLNAMYGANRSPVFANLYTPNSGYDCCWLGQQINDIMEGMFTEMGYFVISGDTDSNFVKPLNGQDEIQVKKDIKKVVDFILSKVPYPQETFDINIESHLDYIMFVKDEDSDKTLKKNYVYVSNGKLKIMGLPIIKSNASKLGILIFNKYLKEQIIKNLSAKFNREYIYSIIQDELKNDITLIAQKYKCNRFELYKEKDNGLYKQISIAYLDKKPGEILLVKNNLKGKVGNQWKYCSIDVAKTLHMHNLDLSKVWNELKPFIKEDRRVNLNEYM